MEVLIGIDPHKATNTVAAVDGRGELVGQENFPANRKGMRALERWAKRFPERRWAARVASGGPWPKSSRRWWTRLGQQWRTAGLRRDVAEKWTVSSPTI